MVELTEPHSRAEIHGKRFGGDPGQQTVRLDPGARSYPDGSCGAGPKKTSHSLRTEPWSDSKKDRFQMASHELLLPCNNSRGPAPAWQLQGWVSPLATWKKCPHISVFLEQKVFLKLHCKQAKKMSMWLKLLEIKWKAMRNHEEAWRSSKSEPGI